MPRTKKTNQTSDETLVENISVEQVWDFLNFSRALTAGLFPGMITPEMLNQRMKETSFSPSALSSDDLKRALDDPKNSEESLRSMVEYMEILSSPFRRIIDYMESMLSLDYTYTVINIDDSSEYKNKQFKKDQKIVFDWLDRFDHQYHFRNVIRQLLRNEIYVACVRDEGSQIVLQELPLQYCKITAKWDYGYLISFNFMYFLQSGVDIDLYPEFFKKKFSDMFSKGNNLQKYNPHLSPELRGKSEYAYWVDLPPHVAFVFKLDPSITTAVPKWASLLPEFIDQSYVRSLQKTLLTSSSSKVLLGQVPMLKDAKTKIADMIAIDSTTLGRFLALVKSSLSDSLKVAAAPLEDMKAISFEGDNELYDSWLRAAISSSGINSSLIYSSKLKANAIESQLSFQSDSLSLEQALYPQFNGFYNYFVGKIKDRKKYKYQFEFEGNAYYLDRKQRFENAMSLANIGIVLPQKIAAAQGMKPQSLIRMMEESKATDFTDLLTPIVSAFQQSGSQENGRPKKSDSELSDEGAETRTTGTNISRGGSI